ncbi:hypothetical protein CABS01_07133, partial [Colletotrichum abscissum]|uniref:uncharacterized protein n=1 Tax=Colletotrichum abscissum TaxID=1671311 RepID=UPI0027D6274B
LDAWLKLGRTKDLAVQAGCVVRLGCRQYAVRLVVYVLTCLALETCSCEIMSRMNNLVHSGVVDPDLDVLGFSSLESIVHVLLGAKSASAGIGANYSWPSLPPIEAHGKGAVQIETERGD